MNPAPDATMPLEARLALARPRLVALCARLVGDPQAAEDLAQETLYEAWRSASRLQAPERWEAWLFGIARHVCLRWHRRNAREAARRVSTDQAPSRSDPAEAPAPDLANFASDYDLEADVSHDELAQLLERVLGRLPPPARDLLVQRYLFDRPQVEIAERLGLSEAAVALRLQRARSALKRQLAAHHKPDLAGYDLLPAVGEEWTETRIWCTTCGRRRLLGQFLPGAAQARFALRCPDCNGSDLGSHADLTLPYYRRLLGSLKAYKPAYLRLINALGRCYQQALATHAAPCLACGRPAALRITEGAAREASLQPHYELRLDCPACGWASNKSLHSYVLALPAGQRFWRASPRMRQLPPRTIEASGAPAIVTRLRSVTTAAGLDVVLARDTFELIGVHPATAI